jgi:hypothetical protein
VRWANMRRRATTLVVAAAAALSGVAFAAAPSASADGLSNPSGTLTVECDGAKSFIQVDWKGANAVTVRWSLEDTGTAPDFSPVLRITARDADGSEAPFVFPGDNAYFILRGGNGHSEVGLKSDWNPGNLADINHLQVRVQNGTTEQVRKCFQERRIYNWTRIGYRKAVDQEGKPYRLGGVGPTYFDCSGLTLTSYNAIPGFPDFPLQGEIRTAEQIYHWMGDNRSPGKRYAKSVDEADLKIGDLVFFENTNPDVVRDAEHVAFWAGDNTLYHAFSPSTPIGFSSYSSYFDSRFVGAYRLLGVETVASEG